MSASSGSSGTFAWTLVALGGMACAGFAGYYGGRAHEKEAMQKVEERASTSYQTDAWRLGSSVGRMQSHARNGHDRTVPELIDRVFEPPVDRFAEMKNKGGLYLHPDFNTWASDYTGKAPATLGVYVYPAEYRVLFLTDNSTEMRFVDDEYLRLRVPWIGESVHWGHEDEPNRFKK